MQRPRTGPDPVSCQSCRSKKLKCNRVQPCSNCAARGVTCNFVVPPQKHTETTSTIRHNEELLERIERLESIVLQPNSVQARSKYSLDNSRLVTRPAIPQGSDGVVDSDDHHERDQDSQLLENVGTREDLLLPRLSNSLVFKICGTNGMLEVQASLNHPHVVVVFPAYRVAIQLFQSYESNLDHMCRILHIPTIRALIRTFYLQINQGESIILGQAALLLSIFAIAAFFYQPSGNSEVATTEQNAVHLSKVFSKSALDVLDHSRRNTSGTLEDIQAYILLSYATYHLDGFSARGRLLETIAASIARDMRLHRLDAGREPTTETETNFRVLIDLEVKRRVFWHIASADWLFSAISGPQEAAYFIHPNQINVRLPKDCNDDDISLGVDNESMVGPTSMSYFRERVRLAHLCREIVDTVPPETSKLMQMPYDQIIALDKKLEDYISTLPVFFRPDLESRQKSKALETVFPNIPVMRNCLSKAAHTRRCKLHQKFLLRQSYDPRYAYSRRACLESARAVLQYFEDLPGNDFPSTSTVAARMGIAIHHMHLALVVMVMDLCFNRDEADREEIKTEVKAALRKFENARDVSPLPDRFLSSLSDMMRKYNVHLTDPSTLTTNHVTGFVHETKLDNDWLLQHSQFGPGMDHTGYALETHFDTSSDTSFNASFGEFWQMAIESEPNLDSVTWDNLFSALDSQPI
ncbi:hypothetical protein NA57DRAFT_61267 [Rhizodiscina lignyota]|uniref:Zn(2)-C6 fungal-type domain-containing protein n=1 Tax=Rhizodiscina lignyota TaxID=1504668 RepID=A0A9P4I215_9PEZI|nr:hypothetical protein NA57DRAFT_61267 [Rhizodiscina lignyota]